MIRCLIVEDEPLAAEILQDYIRDVPGLELAGICQDALYAMDFLQRETVDALFLDIHLPKLKCLDFLKTLSNPPQVIFTTAYHQYALEGYELDVVDYLLKPIEFDRFLKAVQKLKRNQAAPEAELAPSERRYHFFNVNKKRIKIYFDEILYIESLKEYVRIFTAEDSIVTKFQLGEIERFLNDDNLLRIHRSFIVAKDKIKAYTATEIEVGEACLPIGRSYREEIMEILTK